MNNLRRFHFLGLVGFVLSVDGISHRFTEIQQAKAGMEKHLAAFHVGGLEIFGLICRSARFKGQAEIAQLAYLGDAAFGKDILDSRRNSPMAPSSSPSE